MLKKGGGYHHQSGYQKLMLDLLTLCSLPLASREFSTQSTLKRHPWEERQKAARLYLSSN